MRYLTILLLFAGLNVFATNYSSNANGDWNTASTWSPAGIPGAGDNVTIGHNVTLTLTGDLTIASLKGSAAKTLTVSSNGSLHNFNISGTVDLKADLTVILNSNVKMNITGNLDYSGTGGTLTANNGSSITVGGSMNSNGSSALTLNTTSSLSIAGDMNLAGSGSNIVVQTGSTLSVGGTMVITGGVNHVDLAGTVSINQLTASGGAQDLNILSGGTFSVATNATFSGSATFDVQNNGIMDVNGNMSLTGGSTGNVNGNLNVDGTLTFASNSNTISGTGVIAATNVSCPGWMTAAQCKSMFSGTLPIRLTYFKVFSTVDGVQCTWQTASEENNDYFTVERSSDGTNFKAIATITGAGNSNSIINYSYFDNYQAIGTMYYRLKQTDFDGASAYSATECVKLDEHITIKNSGSDLSFSLGNYSGNATITIHNIIGQVVLIKDCNIESNSIIQIPFNAPAGIYLLNIAQDGMNISNTRFYKN